MDYFCAVTRNVTSSILSSDALDFHVDVSHKTGEFKRKYIAERWHLSFTYRDGAETKSGLPLLKIQGSLHKAFNHISGQHLNYPHGYNGNDFNRTEMVYALSWLSKELEIDLFQAKITSVEIGVNILLPFEPKSILEGLLMHKGKTFDSSFNNCKLEAKHSQYRVKCYDKGRQYRDHQNKLRFEIHLSKSKIANDLGCVTLGDFVNPDVLMRFKPLLLKNWETITFYDYSIDKGTLSKQEQALCLRFQNSIYWRQIKPNRRHRPRQKLFKIAQKHSDNRKEQVTQLISEKFDEMCNT